MKKFLLALQFLTIFPVKIKSANDKEIADSLIYFPIAGLFIGLALAGIGYLLVLLNFSRLATDAVLIVSLIAITGGIHLDGLADTCDALLSVRSKDEMLKIMRDPHIGVMGVIGIISILLLKIAFLFSLDQSLVPVGLILMCVLSRWSLVLSLFLFPYARQEGKAKIFSEGINSKIFVLATIITFVCALASAELKGLFIMGIITLFTCLFNKLISKKIGGITGDTTGAIGEINETLTLLFCALLI
ncbi:MAG: adenosylcobinamide-GDP ribazoletransferase [Candidatus Omnitrophica bacterium]|nr:adenosylcobinamide-GDP ribazoletransferase [Candidatus Omnitrophota bacterium]